MNDRELSADGLYTYLSSALDKTPDRSRPAIQFLEILVSVVEQIKADHPAIAASVRKMNIQHTKSKQNDQESDD